MVCSGEGSSPEEGLGVDEIQDALGNVEVAFPHSLTEHLVRQPTHHTRQHERWLSRQPLAYSIYTLFYKIYLPHAVWFTVEGGKY